MIAEHFAEQLHQRLGSGVLVLPTVAVGCSEHHMDFPGTLTLRHETFYDVCEQYFAICLPPWFSPIFLILNSHGGNRGHCNGSWDASARIIPIARLRSPVLAAREPSVAEISESGPGGVAMPASWKRRNAVLRTRMRTIGPH